MSPYNAVAPIRKVAKAYMYIVQCQHDDDEKISFNAENKQ